MIAAAVCAAVLGVVAWRILRGWREYRRFDQDDWSRVEAYWRGDADAIT